MPLHGGGDLVMMRMTMMTRMAIYDDERVETDETEVVAE